MKPGNFAIENLGEARLPSPLSRAYEIKFAEDEERLPFDHHWSAIEKVVKSGGTPAAFEIAGPRAKIFFDPDKTKAAILSCGGICPGVNAVIRGLVLQLWYRYECRNIVGVQYGYKGLAKASPTPITLDPDFVADIHTRGGTVLGSSRGAPSVAEMVDRLAAEKIDVLFTIGGDGTMRGASAIWEEIKKRGLRIAVIGIPKTIDNDIPYVRRTFGFETAVAIATNSIHSAHAEATSYINGIGLVKLMGRYAGYIAANACLATGHANFCLIPEVPFALNGKGGLLELIDQRLADRGHAVIVVAEGAGQYFFKDRNEKDASGNTKLGDIGAFLRDKINAHYAQRGEPLSLKYIDPSYLIRSQAASPPDQLLCIKLAQNAVHAAFAGKSGMLIGYWHGHMTHVPMRALQGVQQNVNPSGELWFSVLEMTGQPATMGA